jgi:hypothetical protein
VAGNPVIAEILRQGRRRPRKQVLAALETGRVESNFSNPSGGDADSAGWRQERASLYADPTNLRASVGRFYNEAAQHDRPGMPAWQLAANVQRPAAQYRTRYRDVRDEAHQLLDTQGRAVGAGSGGSGGGGTTATGFTPDRLETSTSTTFDQAGYERAQRMAFLASRLQKSRGTNNALFKSGLFSTAAPSREDFMRTSEQSRIVSGRTIYGNVPGGAPASGKLSAALKAASKRLGVSESTGWNRGPKVDKWQRSFGMVGQAWCGIFTGVVLREAGVSGINARIASVTAIEQDARAGTGPFRGWTSPQNARAGDLLVTIQGQHVGFIERVDSNGTIHTIEGNTGNGTVARRTHAPGSVYGVAQVRYPRG